MVNTNRPTSLSRCICWPMELVAVWIIHRRRSFNSHFPGQPG